MKQKTLFNSGPADPSMHSSESAAVPFKLDYSKVAADWKSSLKSFWDSETFQSIEKTLQEESKSKTIFPLSENVFKALELTPQKEVKVVILGQDPYHGQGQAHGLSFSVPTGVRLPPSLKNIFKEMVQDLDDLCAGDSKVDKTSLPESGDLTSWARQGVLLLNSSFTVIQSKAGSHRKIGWLDLSDLVIKIAGSGDQPPTVFILWGNDAISKEKWIDSGQHLVIKSVHPSPLSAYRGFFGSKPFSQANQFLIANGREPIEWNHL